MPRDPLDRYYTPHCLADAIVGAVVGELGEARRFAISRAVEPSVGGGAFVRAVRAWLPHVVIEGIDVDADAAGLPACDERRVADFEAGRPRYEHGALVIGNPPYSRMEAHARQALSCAPLVCFLTRASFLGSKARRYFWMDHPPRKVWQIVGRPSFTNGGSDTSEYVAILWDAYHAGPPTLGWLADPAGEGKRRAWADEG